MCAGVCVCAAPLSAGTVGTHGNPPSLPCCAWCTLKQRSSGSHAHCHRVSCQQADTPSHTSTAWGRAHACAARVRCSAACPDEVCSLRTSMAALSDSRTPLSWRLCARAAAAGADAGRRRRPTNDRPTRRCLSYTAPPQYVHVPSAVRLLLPRPRWGATACHTCTQALLPVSSHNRGHRHAASTGAAPHLAWLSGCQRRCSVTCWSCCSCCAVLVL